MSYIIEHTKVAIDLWVILALILLIAVIVFYFIRNKRMQNIEDELEKKLKQADNKNGQSESGVEDEDYY